MSFFKNCQLQLTFNISSYYFQVYSVVVSCYNVIDCVPCAVLYIPAQGCLCRLLPHWRATLHLMSYTEHIQRGGPFNSHEAMRWCQELRPQRRDSWDRSPKPPRCPLQSAMGTALSLWRGERTGFLWAFHHGVTEVRAGRDSREPLQCPSFCR